MNTHVGMSANSRVKPETSVVTHATKPHIGHLSHRGEVTVSVSRRLHLQINCLSSLRSRKCMNVPLPKPCVQLMKYINEISV